MDGNRIASSIAAVRRYLTEHPDQARSTDTPATAVIESGLRARVDGPHGWVAFSDMTKALGGSATAPSPGWLLRASHAACDAIVIAMRAAEEGIALSRLEVTVDSESDDRGLLGMDDGIPAGPLGTRVRIRIAAPDVSDERLREVIDWAREHSPVDGAVGHATPVTVEVEA